jgi:prevent-host-death family protein
MTVTFGMRAARNRFSELIVRAAKGEEIVVTRRGAPVARIVPAPVRPKVKSPDECKQIIEDMRRLRASIAARGSATTLAEIREWIDEGRP